MKNDQQQPTDSSEDWLRQTLGAYRPEAPADAWQRLVPQLPQRKRRRPFVFWLSGAAAVAATAVAFFVIFRNAEMPTAAPVSVEKTPTAAQAAPIVLPDVLEKKGAAGSAEKPATATGEPVLKNEFSRKNGPQPASGLPKNLAAATPAGAVFLKREAFGAFGFSEKPTAAATAFSEKSVPPQTETPLEKLPARGLAPLVLADSPLPEVQFFAAQVLPKKANAPLFWLGIEAAPAFFILKNMGGMPAGLSFPEIHQHPGYGWQTGVSLAFEPLENWRVTLGIQHFRQTHEAQHTATLRLIDGVCLNPNDPGLKEYEFQYAVGSGSRQNDLTLRMLQQDAGSTMPDDEPFALDMKMLHRSAAWRVPLTIERRFGRGKWQGFVRSGAVVDFSEKNKIEVTHFSETCQELCFHSGHVPSAQASATARASVGWLVSAGIERPIFRRAALRFEPFLVGQKEVLQGGLNLGLWFSN